MNKFFIIFTLCLFPFFLSGKEITSELIVTGNVEDITCELILPNEAINLGSYNKQSLFLGETDTFSFDFTLDCTDNTKAFSRVYANFQALSFSPSISANTMSTNLNGVGVELDWYFSGAEAFGFSHRANFFSQVVNPDEIPFGVLSFPLRVKLVHIETVPKEDIELGVAKAGVLISIEYT
ncbi:hypothetical protein D8S93_23505 [Vibrio sp. VGrn 2]|uniref:hypothetical protein n=1 Tax=Vibrio sp. VGrn 2 TaxID=2419839 RepID=UPI00128C8F1A|nr:hypothetical protein [Vibrio sp. VGrn 2]MPS41553.1 hypothetical protein [Vibrio sp. VGrn 2]